MKKAIILLFLVLLAFSLSAQSDINLASEEWEDATNADGSGFYWAVIKLVYEGAGVKVNYSIVPYGRSVNMVENGENDAWVGSYADEEDFVIYPKYAFDADNVAAFSLKGKGYSSADDIIGKKVGWMRGYGFDELLEIDVKMTEVDNRIGGLKMVKAGRIDCFLDAHVELENALKNSGLTMTDFEISTLLNAELYLAFADTDKGKKLLALWDKRIVELHKSGELKKLYDEYDYSSYYPF